MKNNNPLDKFIMDMESIKMTPQEKSTLRAELLSFSSTYTSQKSPYLQFLSIAKKGLAIAFVAIIGIGSSTDLLSKDALPGDTLYPVKIAHEEFRAVTITGPKKLSYEIKRTEKRIQEAVKLTQKENLNEETTQVVAENIKKQTDKVQQGIQEIKSAEPKEALALNSELKSTIKANKEVLVLVTEQKEKSEEAVEEKEDEKTPPLDLGVDELVPEDHLVSVIDEDVAEIEALDQEIEQIIKDQNQIIEPVIEDESTQTAPEVQEETPVQEQEIELIPATEEDADKETVEEKEKANSETQTIEIKPEEASDLPAGTEIIEPETEQSETEPTPNNSDPIIENPIEEKSPEELNLDLPLETLPAENEIDIEKEEIEIVVEEVNKTETELGTLIQTQTSPSIQKNIDSLTEILELQKKIDTLKQETESLEEKEDIIEARKLADMYIEQEEYMSAFISLQEIISLYSEQIKIEEISKDLGIETLTQEIKEGE